MNRPAVTLSVFALLFAGTSAGCSGHSGSAGETTSTASSSSAGSSTAAAKPAGHIGDTLTLTRADGSTIAVTLEGVINPATVTPGPGEPGVTYIATKLKIADPGTVAIDGDVNINVSVSASDGKSHVPDLKNVSECANFDSGMFRLDPGESATGCVVFALPHGVSPTKVKYLPSSGFAEDFGEWTLSGH
ncbi:DUF4352 domain-containing protein [[Mycobacterium] nativiensis]|uniref:DUF4352 domain-containing protein n=1 Tax=[Mycobacterium] nativiensis TaxID=2855503 RepID=A0ABU5XSM2_9MYCO|nr:DUF4352 domain-containing protein [Mycolicibacter sp. MYC340]MEB3030964.1 DUF4352 domain-containing protein [Mycolicibacter sp. MYC340]